MAIRDWPEDARPREKLLKQGAGALTDAELVAVFLRTGVPGKSAVDLARDLIERFGGLGGLCRADRKAACAAPGVGDAKYALLQAVMEMARRTLSEEMLVGDALNSPSAVRTYLRLTLRDKEYEVFCCVFLDAQNRVIAVEELFRGTLTQTSVYPREIVRRALALNAAALILAHNHPSGVAEPSQADHALTRHLKDALALVDVRVLDHFIVAGAASLSFMESGHL
ncbi:MAG TPA: DNA repair protein RadC [Thiobacillaceae bacterium]|nr:DNA repair protein RadC [Thiobacillaceae bacterium]